MKKIKKILCMLLLAAIVITLPMLAGCDSGKTPVETDDGKVKLTYSAETVKAKLDEMRKAGGYSLTLAFRYVSDGETTDSTLTLGAGGDVYYYKDAAGKEDVYDCSADNRITYYTKNAVASSWIRVEDEYSEIYTKALAMAPVSSVITTTVNYLAYYTSNSAYADGFTEDGTATVAGKSCVKYKYSVQYLDNGAEYIYYIEESTGICLKCEMKGTSDGKTSSFMFECTEYKTPYTVTIPTNIAG